MKFQRRLYEPYIVILEDSEPSVWAENRWQRIGSFLTACWASVFKSLLGSSEPTIEKQIDDNGQTCYTVYDPATQQQLAGLSEAEVRVWLEQRYYQKP